MSVNKTSHAVEKWSVPLSWGNATDQQIIHNKVACIPKDQVKAIMEKYKRMEEALGHVVLDCDAQGDPMFNEIHCISKEALDFDPLSE